VRNILAAKLAAILNNLKKERPTWNIYKREGDGDYGDEAVKVLSFFLSEQ